MKLYDLLLNVGSETDIRIYDIESFLLLSKNKVPQVICEMTQKNLIFNIVHSICVNSNQLIVKIYKY